MKSIFKRPLNRRSFVKHSLRFSVLAVLCLAFERRDNLKTEQIKLSFANLPSAFNNFSIVQLSDLHASFWVGRNYLTRMVEETNKLESDLLVITGDFITGAVNDFWKRWLPASNRDYLAMVINVLKHLKGGDKIAVLGNHDQWDGKATENRLVKELEGIGIRVLRNCSTHLRRGKDRLYFAGTDDVWFSYDLDAALREVPNNAFKILLTHSPDATSDIDKKMKIDLILCGHTHGGQVAIPYLSQYFLPIDNPARYMAGLVKESYGYTYVNRGIGTLVFPLRLNAPPEITRFTLKHKTV
jgi:predicted MPP superfamily phosphohydrolase